VPSFGSFIGNAEFQIQMLRCVIQCVHVKSKFMSVVVAH